MAYYMLGARGSEKFTTCKKHSSCSQVLDCLDCPTSLHIVLVAYTGFLVARAGACGWSKRVGFLLSLKACLTTYLLKDINTGCSKCIIKMLPLFIPGAAPYVRQFGQGRHSSPIILSCSFCALCATLHQYHMSALE